jgi:hypothetical protein
VLKILGMKVELIFSVLQKKIFGLPILSNSRSSLNEREKKSCHHEIGLRELVNFSYSVFYSHSKMVHTKLFPYFRFRICTFLIGNIVIMEVLFGLVQSCSVFVAKCNSWSVKK